MLVPRLQPGGGRTPGTILVSYLVSYLLSYLVSYLISYLISYILSYILSCIISYILSCILCCISSYILSCILSCSLSSILSYILCAADFPLVAPCPFIHDKCMVPRLQPGGGRTPGTMHFDWKALRKVCFQDCN